MTWLLLALACDDVLLLNEGARLTNSRNVVVQVRPERAGWEITLGPALDAPPMWRALEPGLAYELSEGEGEKTVFAWLRDAAGRQVGPLRASILLDTLPPRARATAPAAARPGTSIVLVSDVPDAVAMKMGEEGPWIPYASHADIPAEKVVVRYRDEAGNVSEPLVLPVELREDASVIESTSELRSVRISPVTGRRGVVLAVEAVGMREMRIRIDDTELPREAFAARRYLHAEPRRIQVRLWDQLDAEHVAEVAFLHLEGQAPEPDPDRRAWFATLRGGFVFETLAFDALASTGPRELKAGTLAVARLEAGAALSESFYVLAAVEAGQGDEVETLTVEAALGYRRAAGRLLSCDLDLEGQLGVLVSKLDVDVSEFGDFDLGIGLRAALGAQLRVSDSLWAGLSLEFREGRYDWSDDVLSGDESASMRGLGLTAGLSLRF